MKKILTSIFAAALFLIGTQAYAQVSVSAGFMNAQDKIADNALEGNWTLDLNGFYAGASFNLAIPAVNGLGLAPGAFISGLFGSNGNTKYTDFALNIPINVTYGLNLAPDFKLVGFAGPALQIGVIDKDKYTNSGTTVITDYYDEGSTYTYSRFNVLLGAGAGIEVAEKYQVMIGVDFALLPRIDFSESLLGVTHTHKVTRGPQIKIGVGYSF